MIDELLGKFKVGMKCIKPDEIKRFYKAGGKLSHCLESIKLDGARLHAFTDEDGIAHKSYNLKDFQNFGCLNDDLGTMHRVFSALGIASTSGVMFDGEVLDRHAKTRNAKFKSVMQQLHRIHDIDDSGFVFHVFDIWWPGISLPLAERLEIIEEIVNRKKLDRIVAHPHKYNSFSCEEELTEYAESLFAQDIEGIVLKIPCSTYEMRRSPSWLKITNEDTVDLPVLDIIEGEGKLAGHVGKFVCGLGNGDTVKVGPGSATHSMLKEWFDDADKRPKMIEVKYKEKMPSGSLRHPRYYRTRDDKA